MFLLYCVFAVLCLCRYSKNLDLDKYCTHLEMEEEENGESSVKKKATVADLKKICKKVQIPTYDFTEILPGLILGGM